MSESKLFGGSKPTDVKNPLGREMSSDMPVLLQRRGDTFVNTQATPHYRWNEDSDWNVKPPTRRVK